LRAVLREHEISSRCVKYQICLILVLLFPAHRARIKAAAIAAGLSVIVSREVDLGEVAELAISGPVIAVGRPADSLPWNALS
jgi:hypothetical protein